MPVKRNGIGELEAQSTSEMMMNEPDQAPSRRRILATGTFGLTALLLDAERGLAQQGLAPTPACHDGDEPTLPQTEGPFFKPRSPQRSDLREPGIEGQPVELSGHVLTRSCRQIPGALVDLWHADNVGEYDNTGFRLRGHVLTDSDGRFSFRTIMPGLYPGRTRHYHVRIQAPGRSPVLTTQFYFPDERRNRTDALFRRELVMQIAKADHALLARFDVVLI
jgi:protocatechuate 3,4-dioxygenase beta subunit